MHNEIELTLVLDEETWEVIFLFFDLKLETRYIATIGENQVSYRYIKSVGNYFRRCQFGTYTISYLFLLSNVHSTRTRPRNFGRRLQDSYLGPIRRHSETERCWWGGLCDVVHPWSWPCWLLKGYYHWLPEPCVLFWPCLLSAGFPMLISYVPFASWLHL
jgi:hypothetical protein